MEKNIAQTLGISERDFGIFRLLNAYGEMPASTVATRLKMNRTTVFSALRRLIEKGLVCEIPKKSVTWFAATEAEQILRRGKEHLEAEAERVAKLQELVSLLHQEQGLQSSRPRVSFYEGEEGIISLFAHSLQLAKKQCAFLTLEQIPPKILHYLQTGYITEKIAQKVTSRVLLPESARARKYARLDSEGNRTTRLVPTKTIFETEFVITDEQVALIDFASPGIGVLIESPQIARTMQSIFELVWQHAHKGKS